MKEILGRRFGWARVFPLPYGPQEDGASHATWYVLKYVLKGLRTREIPEEGIDFADRWGIVDGDKEVPTWHAGEAEAQSGESNS